MILILDAILLDADGVYLGSVVHGIDDTYVVKMEHDVEYPAGMGFVLSDYDLWYNKEDCLRIFTKDERELEFRIMKEKTLQGDEVERHWIYLPLAKKPLHQRRSIRGVDIITINEDVARREDIDYLVDSYFKDEILELEAI